MIMKRPIIRYNSKNMSIISILQSLKARRSPV
jgi:hypothetical protein